LSDQAVKIHFEASQSERLNEFSAWADKIQVQFRYRLDFLFLLYQDKRKGHQEYFRKDLIIN
jgi:hypothetical protein